MALVQSLNPVTYLPFNQKNSNFIELYLPYIKIEWRRYYFGYDSLKKSYKTLKKEQYPDILKFEHEFCEEIRHVEWFLGRKLSDIRSDLARIEETKHIIAHTTESAVDSKQTRKELLHTIEVDIRKLYEDCVSCRRYYELNTYVICKVGKKLEKIMILHQQPKGTSELTTVEDGLGDDLNTAIVGLLNSPQEATEHDFKEWRNFPSYQHFTRGLLPKRAVIAELTERCTVNYTSLFRRKFVSLAVGELQFKKNKERKSDLTKAMIGFNLGVTLGVFGWVILGSEALQNDLRFWKQPGLFVYTTVGNLLLFRLLWAVDLLLWTKYDINYLAVLQLRSLSSNFTAIMYSTSILLVLYSLNLFLFFQANSQFNFTGHTTILSYSCPFYLLLTMLLFRIYEQVKYGRTNSNLFSWTVLYNCIRAPYVPITFRDMFAADVLTSFTKVISDGLYATCWIVSGSFLSPSAPNKGSGVLPTSTNFGSNYLDCTSNNMIIVISAGNCIPLYMRAMQCLRMLHLANYRPWPFLFNAIKYLLSIVVVVYGLFQNSNKPTPAYLVVIVLTTLYKWFWDVVMDWGLGDVKPALCTSSSGSSSNSSKSNGASGHTDEEACRDGGETPRRSQRFDGNGSSYTLLRAHLLFNNPAVYYVCIVLDLALRFLWVISLAPKATFYPFVGPQLSFFLGSVEIVRRLMWCAFRMEYEQIKNVLNQTPGFLPFHRYTLSSSGREDEQTSAMRLRDESYFALNELETRQRKKSMESSSSPPRPSAALDIDTDIGLQLSQKMDGGIDSGNGTSSSGISAIETKAEDSTPYDRTLDEDAKEA